MSYVQRPRDWDGERVTEGDLEVGGGVQFVWGPEVLEGVYNVWEGVQILLSLYLTPACPLFSFHQLLGLRVSCVPLPGDWNRE